ncbi:MAG: hypothetical protein WB392_00900 [Methanotrichaceae archaeon]
MGRRRKNKDGLVGRAGRQIIELEDLERDAPRWRRRKEVIARFAAGRTTAPSPDY